MKTQFTLNLVNENSEVIGIYPITVFDTEDELIRVVENGENDDVVLISKERLAERGRDPLRSLEVEEDIAHDLRVELGVI